MSEVRFKTRARTIDHLGQNQIADCPTAISELWKNAYDAYAQDVALHIFEGDKNHAIPPMAAIVDNGHGMSHDEFVDRWLVVGTESKAGPRETIEADRRGLPRRVPQGQKGIGRLSVAYLGPLCLIISKRSKHDYVTSLIDWRVFENPYLLLEDVIVPVEEFANKEDFFAAFETMKTLLSENVWPTPSSDKNRQQSQRNDRVADAWARYDADLLRNNKRKASDEIAETIIAFENLTDERLSAWPVWAGDSPHGTALFVLSIKRELSVWVDPETHPEDAEAKYAKDLLEDTLVSFVDPYKDDVRSNFRYNVVIHEAGVQRRRVTWEETLTLEQIRELEHVIEGEVDESGVFRGRLRAFGVDRGELVLPPQRGYPRQPDAQVGSFKILLATFEQEKKSSSLTQEQHELWLSRTERFGGFAVYRDDLRVLPYGRVQGDLFDIDERRGKHAGRYFWAYRRSIGRIALTRDVNLHLVDKAGREGLKDNRARREFKIRIIDLLETTAQRYFGSDAPDRREKIQENQERHEAAVKAASRRSRRQFRAALKSNAPALDAALESADQLLLRIEESAAQGATALMSCESDLMNLRRKKGELAIASPPRDLDPEDEQRYRVYRENLRQYRDKIERASEAWANALAKHEVLDPVAVINGEYDSRKADVLQALSNWRKQIFSVFDKEKNRILEQSRSDVDRFVASTSSIIADVAGARVPLATAVAVLEKQHEEFSREVSDYYVSYLRLLERLVEGIDVEGALRWSSEEIEALKARVSQVNSLAQLGVTVEIVGHEFESLDAEIRRNLSKLPLDARRTEAFRGAQHAHHSLTAKLRFLTPLKLSGPRTREAVRGKIIADYVRDFFAERISKLGVAFVATEPFCSAVVTDYPSRLFPVFINLVNNALYWVATTDGPRQVWLDRIGDDIIVADSGRGVDPDDIPRLFELFFTRRVEGRGVGLYLCRENLGAGGHTIDYAQDSARRVLCGANFVIHFRGIERE